MGFHQYIGARYVPTFYQNSLDPTSCEWENNVNYEPLTVVTLPNLHSYISKKYVPDTIGTPASNPEYWLDRGYDNAYIQAVQDQVDQLQLDFDDLAADYLKEFNLSDLAYFQNKKVCIIGDSISTAYPPNWANKFEDMLTNVQGCTVTNISVAGSSMYGWGLVDIGNVPNDQDIYIIELGVNDWQGQFQPSDLRDAMDAIDAVVNRQGTDVYYLSPIKCFLAGADQKCNPIGIYRYFFETYADFLGWRVIAGYNAPALSNATKSLYLADGLHPATPFGPILAAYVMKGILSGVSTFSAMPDFTISVTPDAGLSYNSADIKFRWSGASKRLTISIIVLQAVLTTGWITLCDVYEALHGPGFIPFMIANDTGFTEWSNQRRWGIRIQNKQLQICSYTAETVNVAGNITFDMISVNSPS